MTRVTQAMGRALLGALVLAFIATAGWSQSITWLGTLGGYESRAYGVSADGSVVVGWAYGVSADGAVVVGGAWNAAGSWRAFRWTEAGGMQDLDTLGRYYSEAWGVSADGSVVVGVALTAAGQSRAFRWENGVMQDLGTLPGGDWSRAMGVSADGSVVVGEAGTAPGQSRTFLWRVFFGRAFSWRAFLWTEAGGMQDLGTLPGGDCSQAFGVSADGSVVVGEALIVAAGQDRAFPWQNRAFRWQNGVMQDLGTLGGDESEASAVSADGSVVVGWATNAAGQDRAFRWTVSGGMQDLGTLPGGGESQAFGVSADGSVVVGWALTAAGYGRAFRWTEAGGMQDLGTLPGSDLSWAMGVSADGSVVVGEALIGAGQSRAFRWTAAGGMEDLNITYANLLINGSVLTQAYDISPNGRYIVGVGYNAATGRYEAFLLDTVPEPASLLALGAGLAALALGAGLAALALRRRKG
jgi:probable HAF family extracellular repeat protein